MQDIKEDFLVKMLDVEAIGLSSWTFAKVDASVTLIILFLFCLLSWVKSNITALCLLLLLVMCGTSTLGWVAMQYPSIWSSAIGMNIVPVHSASLSVSGKYLENGWPMQ